MTQYFYFRATTPTPSRMVRRLVSNTATLRSALSYGTQTITRAGEHWELDVEWLNVTGDELADLRAFLARLNGATHRVGFHQFDITNRGAWTGSPVVDGGGQTGNVIQLRGVTPSVTGYARAGDIFHYGSDVAGYELKMVVTDADSDPTGNVAVEIAPYIRQSPNDGDSIDAVGDIVGTFILTNAVVTDASAPSGRGPGAAVSTVRATFVEDVK